MCLFTAVLLSFKTVILNVGYMVPTGLQENDGKWGAVVTYEWATEIFLPE
jgi:hypothetical protein